MFKPTLDQIRFWFRRKLYRLKPYRHYAVSRDGWDHQYRSDQWAWLNDVSEMARYAVIAGYIRRLKPDGAVLDIGCGEGLLPHYLHGAYANYVGVDISAESIQRARARRHAATEFVATDATTFTPLQPADVIVFNECLYYMKHPMEVITHHKRHLSKDGIMIASMYLETAPLRIWDAIQRRFNIIDEIRLVHPTGKEWTVKAFTSWVVYLWLWAKDELCGLELLLTV